MRTNRHWIERTWFLLVINTVLGVVTTTCALVKAAPQSVAVWKWQAVAPLQGPAPDGRAYGTATYDPVGRRIIVFGGLGNQGFLNDLWSFDLSTSAWTKLEPTGGPPSPRRGHNAIYDPVRHQIAIWAGQGAGFFNDTWTLNLTTLEWRNVTPPTRPVSRYGSASVYDPVERRLVQFAGFTSESRRFNDTQAFNLDTNTWTDLTPGSRPGVRCLHTAAFDSVGRRMIMYGGQRSGALDDLWAFDLTSRTWTDLMPATRPAGRFFATSFVDGEGNFTVFGGSTSAGDVNETWAYDFASGQWSKVQIDNPPSKRNGMMGAYIPEEERFIIIGGSGGGFLNDVWELRRQ
jgi:hypothetical protein